MEERRGKAQDGWNTKQKEAQHKKGPAHTQRRHRYRRTKANGSEKQYEDPKRTSEICVKGRRRGGKILKVSGNNAPGFYNKRKRWRSTGKDHVLNSSPFDHRVQSSDIPPSKWHQIRSPRGFANRADVPYLNRSNYHQGDYKNSTYSISVENIPDGRCFFLGLKRFINFVPVASGRLRGSWAE